MSLTLSVIIPVRNGMNDLALSVAAILRSTVQPEEILIVDDGSKEPLPGVVGHPLCRVIRTTGNTLEKKGSFHARNLAAKEARGGILVFIDSDVCVTARTLEQLQQCLKDDKGLTAVFGGYDEDPPGSGLVSQYRNLLHAYMHQSGNPAAHTFWTGCGAIRRGVFLEFGGFALDRLYLRDIELGVRLSKAGRRILLDKSIEVKHLKRWTLASVIRTDIFYRGANWTEICLRFGHLPNDMNTRMGERLSVMMVYLLIPCVPLGIVTGSRAICGIALLLLAVYLFLSRAALTFLSRAKGAGFALKVIPLHVLYHLCGGAGFLIGVGRWLLHPRR